MEGAVEYFTTEILRYGKLCSNENCGCELLGSSSLCLFDELRGEPRAVVLVPSVVVVVLVAH